MLFLSRLTSDSQKLLFDEYFKEYVPRHCGYLEKQLATNSGGKGFFVGDKVREEQYPSLPFISGHNDTNCSIHSFTHPFSFTAVRMAKELYR